MRKYAELYLGVDDIDWCGVCRGYRKYGGGDGCRAWLCGRSCVPVYYHGRDHGTFLSSMFPRIPKKHESRKYIATNFIANILGLGWACTPAGLKAMEELAKLEEERGNPAYAKDGKEGLRGRAASNEMCTFLILNTSSLQLIPVNMIVYRTQYGSANPAAVIAPAILATLFSTIIAIVYCKIKDRK